jgi:hypothetical protein
MYLLITIDTEGDNAWSDHSAKPSARNARYLPRFQELCDRFGFKPTYLTSYEMAKDEFFGEFAADAIKKGTCEVGLHPHPWNSPPEYKLTSDDLANKPYMIEYPEAIIREKVKVLTDLLQERFGVKMVSHRAGRWAFIARGDGLLMLLTPVYSLNLAIESIVLLHPMRRISRRLV